MMIKQRSGRLKRSLSILLALIMCVSMISVTAFAQEKLNDKCPTPELYISGGGISVESYWLKSMTVGVGAETNGGTRTSGYTYYYTTDGTDPTTTNGSKTTVPSISSGTMKEAVDGVLTYKIIATKDGMEASDVATFLIKVQPNGSIAFADSALKQAIMSALGVSGEVDTAIYEEQLTSLTELVAENAGITNLTGLEYAQNLQVLDLSGNDLSSGVAALGSRLQTSDKTMSNLVTVDLSNCNIGANVPDLSIFMQRFFGAAIHLESIDLSNNNLVGEVSFTQVSNLRGTFDDLKFVNLSNNDLYGVSFSTNWSMKSIENIDMSSNRVYLNENSGSWYSNAVSIGLDNYDFSNQKSYTELKDYKINGSYGTNGFTKQGLDNENALIVLPDTYDPSIELCLRGYGNTQTLSGINNSMDMPVMIAAPGNSDVRYWTVELNVGENVIPLSITHVSGECVNYTIKITRCAIPNSDSEESAGITEVCLQRAVCEALNKLDGYDVDYRTYLVTKEDMSKITSLEAGPISDIKPLFYASNVTKLYISIAPGADLELDFSNWSKLESCSFIVTGTDKMFHVTDIRGTENAVSLNDLDLYAELDDAAMEQLTHLRSLTCIQLHGSCSKPLELTKLDNLTTIGTPVAADGTLPDFSKIPKLEAIYIYNCSTGAVVNAESNDNLRIVGFYEANGYLNIKGAVTSSFQLIVRSAENSNINFDFDGITGGTSNCTMRTISNGAGGNITFKGKSDNFQSMEITGMKSVVFEDSFSSANLTKLEIAARFVKLPQASSVPALNALDISSATDLTAWPVEINEMTSLNTLSLLWAPFENYNSLDLSNLSNLKSLNLGGSMAITGVFDITKLPDSLQSFRLSGTGISELVGEKQFDQLLSFSVNANRLVKFPAAQIKNMPNAILLEMDDNLYTEIPEDAFDNATNAFRITVGSWIPVIEVDGKWIPDPATATGKACANEAVTVSIGTSLGIASGTYSGLTAIETEDGTVIGDVFTERTIRVMTSTDKAKVGLKLTPLLGDTEIKVNGKVYTAGSVIDIDIEQLTTTVTIECSNPYTNYMDLDTTTTYTVEIISGEYMDKFVPEEGHYYNINYSLKKLDGSFSMADSYFTNIAQVKYENGRFEIRYSSTSADLINGMKYNANGTEEFAEVVYQEGTYVTYRIYADSVNEKIDITPRVAPMGNVYTTCYMIFDLTKAMDITASMGIDKADLNAAINKAIAITEKNHVYTSDSYSAMLAALEEAQKVAELSTPTQNAVDKAKNMLILAIDSLVVDETKLADKLALETAINDAKAIEKGNHTDTAWNALQEAIADAQTVYDTLEARQTEVDSAVKSLNTAVTLFNSSGEASTLDKNDLQDGIYSIHVDMVKTNRTEKSMADNAINHTAKLEVINGEYFVTLDFRGITIENRFGYLRNLSYYADGYTYGQYGTVEGTLVPAEVLSTQKDSDGDDVIDPYNDANNLYPDIVRIKLVSTVIEDEGGYVPLHVFVPIMESIAAGNGDQDVLMKIDWSTLKATTEEDPDFKPEEPVEQSPAVDVTDTATGVKVHADKGVFEEGVKLVVTPITFGADYDNAVSALEEVGKKFKLYEIYFEDADGNNVQPNGMVKVSYPIPAGYDATNVVLYRINNDGSKTLIKGVVEDGYYTVITKSFSTYALVEKESTITDAQNTDNVDNGTVDDNNSNTGDSNDNSNNNNNNVSENPQTGVNAAPVNVGNDNIKNVTTVNNGSIQSTQTGDIGNQAVWFLLTLASGGTMIVLMLGRKRKNRIGE